PADHDDHGRRHRQLAAGLAGRRDQHPHEFRGRRGLLRLPRLLRRAHARDPAPAGHRPRQADGAGRTLTRPVQRCAMAHAITTTELFLIAMAIIFAVPYLVWRLARTDYWAPLVVVQIIAGILLGPGVLGKALPEFHATV